MAYLAVDVSRVEDIDESAWDRIIESSWSALETNFPWEGLPHLETKEQKKLFLVERRNSHIFWWRRGAQVVA